MSKDLGGLSHSEQNGMSRFLSGNPWERVGSSQAKLQTGASIPVRSPIEPCHKRLFSPEFGNAVLADKGNDKGEGTAQRDASADPKNWEGSGENAAVIVGSRTA
jgi:hypothetical protein